MNIPRIAWHVAVSSAASGLWLAGVNLPEGTPSLWLQTAAGLPWLVASVTYATAHRQDVLTRREPVRPVEGDHFTQLVRLYSPRAVDARRPRAVATSTRPASRKELAR
ncbi:hypothetical protein [Plantactinospora sp. CA-290183]|uniref:hypothetical protein n=1 Tax=Plantactinospora sp. CA-290183 TaxID=3240006 RepID=UPI003D932FF2